MLVHRCQQHLLTVLVWNVLDHQGAALILTGQDALKVHLKATAFVGRLRCLALRGSSLVGSSDDARLALGLRNAGTLL